jgi:pyruvate/2-oxoglutarate dehydrogenase complex dihydrolipoamide acyltransferase (E2) component
MTPEISPAADTAEATGANDEYASDAALAGAPLPPAIHNDALDVARDPEQTEAARQEAADDAGTEPQPAAEPAAAERLTGDYDKANTEALDAELDARRAEGREIEVTGTGKDGNIVNADRIKALEADDQARSAA